MARACSICRAGDAPRVDALLSDGLGATAIAEFTGVSLGKIRSHVRHAKIERERTEDRAADSAHGEIETQLREQVARLRFEIEECKKRQEPITQIRYETQLAKSLELLSKIEDTRSHAKIADNDLNSNTRLLVGVILNALSAYPEARDDVHDALQRHLSIFHEGGTSRHG